MSNYTEIAQAIAPLWASFIERIEFDILNLRMSLHLVAYESNTIEKHSMIFDGVSSFFFVNGEGESRFNTEQWENAELSEIHYFDPPQDSIKHTSNKAGTPQFMAEPRFYLEIWSSVLMIEAKVITVDGTSYVL
jgi:hypothetical protein